MLHWKAAGSGGRRAGQALLVLDARDRAHPREGGKITKVGWLEDLETLVAAIIFIGLFVVGLFRYGARSGQWFAELSIENRRLYWAGIALVCWTIALGAGAWLVHLLRFLAFGAKLPDSPAAWAVTSSIALVSAAFTVALFAGIPWLVLVSLVRALRWWKQRAGVFEHGE